jgi:hypothetical protein
VSFTVGSQPPSCQTVAPVNRDIQQSLSLLSFIISILDSFPRSGLPTDSVEPQTRRQNPSVSRQLDDP